MTKYIVVYRRSGEGMADFINRVVEANPDYDLFQVLSDTRCWNDSAVMKLKDDCTQR